MAYDNFLIDKRVVERNIAKGLVEPELLKQQIEALPDREANLVHVSLEGGAQPSEGTADAAIRDTAPDLDVDDDDEDDDDDDVDDADEADDDDDDDDDAADDADAVEADAVEAADADDAPTGGGPGDASQG